MTLVDKTMLVRKCVELFDKARGSVADAIGTLYLVYKTEAWSDQYGSWSEFCESGLQISKSLGSQYIAVYKNYIEEGGLTVKRLREVDIGKAYLALALPGNAQEKLAKAESLTRNELRAESAMKENGDEHECEAIKVCRVCWKRMD